MAPSVIARLDRFSWYAISVSLAILVILSFVRISRLDAFVELKSSALRLEFINTRPEAPMAYFGPGTTIVNPSAAPALKELAGSALKEISALSSRAGLRLEALRAKEKRARACLLEGRYSVSSMSRKGGHMEVFVTVGPDEEQCVDLAIGEDFLVLPRRIVVEPRKDSRGVEIHPDMAGKLRIRDTDKELSFVSGMTLQVELEEKPATVIAFSDGRFGMHAWKTIRVLSSERDRLDSYFFTPLDILKKYAGDNGLWFSISLMIGIVFGIRKLLLLR